MGALARVGAPSPGWHRAEDGIEPEVASTEGAGVAGRAPVGGIRARGWFAGACGWLAGRVTTAGMTMKRSIVRTAHAPAAIGPYSQAVVVPMGGQRMVFCSGQIALDPKT